MSQSSHDLRFLTELLYDLGRHLARVDLLHRHGRTAPQRLEHLTLTALTEHLTELQLIILDAELSSRLLKMIDLLHRIDIAVLIRQVDRAVVEAAQVQVACVREGDE
jgi:hypothetical protein